MTWPTRKVPIYFASSGPKSLQLAGRIADGVLFQAGADTAMIQYAIENVRLGAKQAGRDHREITLCARLGCSVSENRDAARNQAKPYAAAAAETVFQSKPQTLLSPELLSDLRKLKEGYDYYEHANPAAKHRTMVTDRVIDSMVIAGTPDEVVPRFRAIMDLGVDRIVITPSVKDPRALIQTLAEKVIPRLG
jgi:5,10-methylenetetrahydromethanopterin reductase